MSEQANPKVVDFKQASHDSDGANRGSLRNVRARVIEVRKDANGLTASQSEPGSSNKLPEEPFHALAEKGLVIEPPFDMLTLAMLVEHSSELNQCVEAMETNIDSTGHRFVSRLRLDDVERETPEEDAENDGALASRQAADEAEADRLRAEANREKVRLENFFSYATEESFTEFRKKLRKDLETTGNGYFEVLRNAKGDIQGFTHLPAYQMRLGKLDEEARLVERKILELQPDGSVRLRTQQVWKRFRRYVQSRSIQRRHFSTLEGHLVRWYKSFGDTRTVDAKSGKFEGDRDGQEVEMKATEVVHLRHYSPRSPYGLPRFIGNLLSIFGDRASEEINYITFRNNNIPSMVVLVSNGQLTQGTIDRINSFVESQVQGSDNYSKFLIVEGEPFGEEGEDGGQVKVDLKPLTQDQHKDALFQGYSKNNQDKIRRAFRLPPIFVGRSDDYTRATAEASRRLADEQIFRPERDEFDQLMNRIIFPEMGIRYHKFKSNSPNTTDNEQLVKILAGAEKTGGMTPRIARVMLEDILGIDLPPFPKGFPADTPFSQTMAEAVKNKGDASEPGQQVTALKAIDMLTGGDLDFDDDEEKMVSTVKKLFRLQKAAEAAWREGNDISGEE